MNSNSSSNSSSPSPGDSEDELNEFKAKYYSIGVPILLGLCVISTIANGYILLAVKLGLRRTPSPLLCITLSLCLADLWMTLSMSVSFLVQSYLPNVYGVWPPYHMCVGLGFEAIRMGAMITSVMHLLALALNHYIGITRPLHYSATVTPEFTYKLIAVLWTIPPLAFLLYFSVIPGQAFLSRSCIQVNFWTTIEFRLIVSSFITLPLIIMSCMYSHISVVLIKRKTDRNLTVNQHQPTQMRRTLKAMVTTALYLVSFLLGWMPSVLVFLLVCHQGCLINPIQILSTHPQILIMVGIIVNTLIILKSLLDAMIYAARVREIQAAILAMKCRCWCNRNYDGLDRGETYRYSRSYSVRNPSRLSARQTSPLAKNKFVQPDTAAMLRINSVPTGPRPESATKLEKSADSYLGSFFRRRPKETLPVLKNGKETKQEMVIFSPKQKNCTVNHQQNSCAIEVKEYNL